MITVAAGSVLLLKFSEFLKIHPLAHKNTHKGLILHRMHKIITVSLHGSSEMLQQPIIKRKFYPFISIFVEKPEMVEIKSISVIPVRAEPDFVGSALVRESSGSKDGDDDKIYFFFSERALELDCDTELTVARVARVCKVLTCCFK